MSQAAVSVTRFLLVAGLLALIVPQPVRAQSDDGRRQQVFEQLLQSLIDSQMNQGQQNFRDRPGQNLGPNLPGGNPERATPQVQEVRQIARSVSQEASRLFNSLNQDTRQNRNLSAYFNDILKVNANATVLAQRAERAWDLENLREDYVTLDRDWRQLSYGLNGTPGMSQASTNSIRTLNDLNQRLSRLFNVTAQIDSVQFQRLAEALEVSLRNLMEDLSTELGWTNETRQLLVTGRMVEQQARYIAYNTEIHRNRELAVAEFNKFKQLWTPYSAQLWTHRNRYIQRNLQRIEQTEREIQQVLLIPISIDHNQLKRLSDVLIADIERLSEQITLADLIKLEAPGNILKTSKDFATAANRFADSVKRNRNLTELQTEYRMVELQWRNITDSFQGNNKAEVLRILRTTDQTMQSLKHAVQIRSTFDRNRALQLVAALENYGKHLQEDFSTYVVQGGRYDRGFAYQGLHTCNQFTAFANNIHQSLADGVPPEELRERAETLSRGWQYLNTEFLMKLQGAERERLTRLAGDITPQIVQLQTMFAF